MKYYLWLRQIKLSGQHILLCLMSQIRMAQSEIPIATLEKKIKENYQHK